MAVFKRNQKVVLVRVSDTTLVGKIATFQTYTVKRDYFAGSDVHGNFAIGNSRYDCIISIDDYPGDWFVISAALEPLLPASAEQPEANTVIPWEECLWNPGHISETEAA